jgi:acetyl esterase/lipase
MYLPYGHTNPDGTDEREQWQISPNLAQTKILAQAPSTWIAVAEHDLLATEALAFSSQLRAAGVTCKVKVYSGCPHPILTLSGALTKGQELLLDAAQALTAVFWPVRLDPFLGWTLVPG